MEAFRSMHTSSYWNHLAQLVNANSSAWSAQRGTHIFCLGVHMWGGGFFVCFFVFALSPFLAAGDRDACAHVNDRWLQIFSDDMEIDICNHSSQPPLPLPQSHPQFLTDTTLAACPEMSNLLPETRRWYSTMTAHLKKNICRNQVFFTLGLISTISQAFIYHLDLMIATSIFYSLLLKNLREKKTMSIPLRSLLDAGTLYFQHLWSVLAFVSYHHYVFYLYFWTVIWFYFLQHVNTFTRRFAVCKSAHSLARAEAVWGSLPALLHHPLFSFLSFSHPGYLTPSPHILLPPS